MRDEAAPREELTARIAAAIAACGTRTLVVAGELPGPLSRALPGYIEVRGQHAPLDGLDSATVSGLLFIEEVPAGEALDRLLGTACRRFPGRLLVWTRCALDSPPVAATRFYAHGFRRLLAGSDDRHRHALHEYRLAEYKQPPDWLNARYWANPERFAVEE